MEYKIRNYDRKFYSLGYTFLLALILLAPPASGQPADSGLGKITRIDGPTRVPLASAAVRAAPGARSQQPRETYRYRNDDERALIGYQHRCIVATSEGRVGWSSTGTQSIGVFSRRAVPPGDPRGREGWVRPGQTFDIEVGVSTWRDGPFAVQSCGLVSVSFDDGTVLGAPEIVSEIVERRRRVVTGLEETASALDKLLSRLPVDRTYDALTAFAEVPRHVLYESELDRIATEIRTTGRLPLADLESLRSTVRRNLQEGRAQLRIAEANHEEAHNATRN